MTQTYGSLASVRGHPFQVRCWQDWGALWDALEVGFQTYAEARRFAESRPEPLIDLIQKDRGVTHSRRLIAYPGTEAVFTPRDDFPQPMLGWDPSEQ